MPGAVTDPLAKTPRGTTMGDKAREALQLRSIRVSARSALSKAYSIDIKEAIKDRADDLLADLEANVIRDGGDEQIIAAIDATRRELRE